MDKRKVCFVTGTRAEYGLHHWLLKEIKSDPELELFIVATGMHLSPEFGLTYKAIEHDGFVVNEKVEMLLSSDTPVGIAKSMGIGTIGFAEVFDRINPDIALIPCDRFEALAAAQAAMISRIPIAHTYGGEATEGLIDDPIRYSLTKMSHFHFVTNEVYEKRVVQLGEHPDNVFNYGAPQLDHLRRTSLLGREEFEKSINFQLNKKSCIVTYHPVTFEEVNPGHKFRELLDALSGIGDLNVVFTKCNADTNGRIINQMIDDYVKQNSERACAFTSLGQRRYLSALHHVNAVVGNSSSGIIEAPAVPVPTVNLGDRQGGRLKASSVIDCEEKKEDIMEALEKALSPSFREEIQDVSSPYGDGRTAPRIKEKLKAVPLGEDVLKKGFYDLDFSLN
jgi:UDP-N-acetylglucosamine 2-epimerase (non-hydrolysing)/GDP/UDP-N,N'-diacetylbacillosamine 2-epimerase (hydrolysing)